VQAVTKIFDYGTANPIVARLTVQIFAILEHCEIAPETWDGIKVIYMNCLARIRTIAMTPSLEPCAS
jgi:hypothetical protein